MNNDYGNLELHKVLLSAMKDIDKICRENNLNYFLHAGTLLGALNYKGFIPWDDDVDISLFRDDYEKLINILIEKYSDIYFIENYKTQPYFSHNRTVLRVLGTEMIHQQPDPNHNEIGIDIIPLDSTPRTKIQQFIQQKKIKFLDLLVQINLKNIIPNSLKLKFFVKFISIFFNLNRTKLGFLIDKECTKYNRKNNSTHVGLLSYVDINPYTGKSGYENDLMLREWYENPIYVAFEDTEFMTISAPEKDLIHRYGPDWNRPYPEEKRIRKHGATGYIISDEVRKRLEI